MGALTLYACALFVVGNTALSANQVGLALSNSIQLLVFFSILVRYFNEVQAECEGVQRIETCVRKIQPEEENGVVVIPPKWPAKGHIKCELAKHIKILYAIYFYRYQSVVMRYAPLTPRVLRNVDLDITAGMKVGVVGRTGSGKSSLIMALFRLVTLSHGKIEIDGLNVLDLPLREFRSKLSIIPQGAGSILSLCFLCL